MAGVGRPPKDPSTRARRNKAPELRMIEAEPADQPHLPRFEVEDDGRLTEFVWPARTVEWWAMWRDSPLAPEFTANDWSELQDTALIHAAFWSGNLKMAAELRLRVAKFGATPEDRARLKIVFAQAAEVDSGAVTTGSSRAQGLKLVNE